MIRTLTVLTTQCTDPYHNLALEKYLLDRVEPGECILYLWQNQRTVVIGRNQNAGSECRVPLLLQEGGRLARRLSGGGAVYHDLGNLNFTFLMPSEDFSKERQNQVLLSAVQCMGIHAEVTGRNDLTVDGQKFSGHAYYHHGGRSYHHGTLMVNVDKAPLARYLNVPPLKLKAKGVASVRSRVGNLTDWNPSLTVDALREALIAAFEAVYALPARRTTDLEIDSAALAEDQRQFASQEWLYGSAHPLDASREARFAWGTVRVDFSVRDGRVTEAALWSDGLEADYLDRVPSLLAGTPAQYGALRAALTAEPQYQAMAADIAAMIDPPGKGDTE